MLKLEAIGHLGKDAEQKTLPSGKTVINFSIAHTDRWKDNQGQQQEKTTWIECAYWTEKTKIMEYLKKGKQVYVEGTPEVRTWESNGKSGAGITVRIREIQLLGVGGEGKGGAAVKQETPVKNINNSYANNPGASSSDDDTELPDNLPF